MWPHRQTQFLDGRTGSTDPLEVALQCTTCTVRRRRGGTVGFNNQRTYDPVEHVYKPIDAVLDPLEDDVCNLVYQQIKDIPGFAFECFGVQILYPRWFHGHHEVTETPLNSTRSKAGRDEADCLFDLDSAVTRSVQWRGQCIQAAYVMAQGGDRVDDGSTNIAWTNGCA